MATDSIGRLHSAKAKADQAQADRDNYGAYIEAMREFGWTDDDADEYIAEVERILAKGTDDERAAAREFWMIQTAPGSERGINARIRRSIAEAKRLAA